jgi:hypothetical protein
MLKPARDMGLDHSEVRSWIGWYRHVTLVLLAHAFLVGICVQDQAHKGQEEDRASFSRCLLPLTVPEVRHLLAHLIWPHPRNVHLLLTWLVVAQVPPQFG